ncbi:uncharacterized protein BDZ99DRAFT_468260 [Mytilinidion resinicola]|uniref:DUF2470 domain-containing protein n=1 Tax=Mytilinidion resinicola TaxID=574789 RepID=A0A6A6Y4X9_9PEZI|nr:uncharacterized protein BDZ99DRAFT_468260 [Mytilinidion resinicola]KAF2803285.1 hypothetical protein BDZ99DRAFT_468260 [Mytilinidion resinicola]
MSATHQQCGFSGNSDLYGLGIRIGVYLQWFTSQIAFYFHLEGSNDLSDAYILFSIALEIALFVLTFQDGTYTIEIVVMFYMFFGGILSVKGYRKRFQEAMPTTWRLLLGNATIMAMSIYGSWFWIKGRSGDRFLATPCGNTVFLFGRIPARHFERASNFFAFLSLYCAVAIVFGLVLLYKGPLMNIFRYRATRRSSVDARNQTRRADLIEWINKEAQPSLALFLRYSCALSSTSALSAHLVDIRLDGLHISADGGTTKYVVPIQPAMKSYGEIWDRLKEMHVEADEAVRDGSIGAESDVTSVLGRLRVSRRHLRRAFKVFRSYEYGVSERRAKQQWIKMLLQMIHSCAPIYSILAIELTLKWNKVSGVYTVNSTGQLIPFVIGVAGFLKVFDDVKGKYKQRRLEKKREELNHGMGEHGATSADQIELVHVAPEYHNSYGMQSADGKWV